MPSRTFIDQMGRTVSVSFPPKKIISLVPSQTELLFDLGLHQEVVGITKFCVHPNEWMTTKKIIGGTKQFHFDEIDALQPDLIIGNKEENYKEGIERLDEKYPVWMSDIFTLEDSLFMIASIGALTDKKSEADKINKTIQSSFSSIKKFSGESVLYMIWRNPWMAAGQETFINNILERIGLKNALNIKRYPELTSPVINELKPDYIFLSSEPYPFKEKHIEEIRKESPSSKILLVDGEMFSWYGSRLVKAPMYFNSFM